MSKQLEKVVYQVFLHMLFPDVIHRNLLAFTVGDGDAEDALAQEDSLGMASKSAMAKIWEEDFGLIEPGMDS